MYILYFSRGSNPIFVLLEKVSREESGLGNPVRGAEGVENLEFSEAKQDEWRGDITANEIKWRIVRASRRRFSASALARKIRDEVVPKKICQKT